MAATKSKASGNGSVKAADRGIVIPKPNIQSIDIPIVGVTPLIVHAWSTKAVRMMLEKQMKMAKAPLEAKDPEADYQASRYVADVNADGTPADWDGVPAPGFKAALVGACRAVDGLPMTLAKRMCYVMAEGRSTRQNVDLVRIRGEHRMRQDMVRLESGTADIRFRAEFPEWSAVLKVEFNAGVISGDQIVHLIELAGYSEGICEWRPSAPNSSTGNYGRWKLAD